MHLLNLGYTSILPEHLTLRHFVYLVSAFALTWLVRNEHIQWWMNGFKITPASIFIFGTNQSISLLYKMSSFGRKSMIVSSTKKLKDSSTFGFFNILPQKIKSVSRDQSSGLSNPTNKFNEFLNLRSFFQHKHTPPLKVVFRLANVKFWSVRFKACNF